jgi:tellurite resistance protein TehA-like permease
MNSGIQALLAVMPIIAAAVLLVGFRWPAKRAMPIVYAAAALIAFFAWQMSAIIGFNDSRTNHYPFNLMDHFRRDFTLKYA